MIRALVTSVLALALAGAAHGADELKVTLLGTGSPNPDIHRFSMSTLVEAGEQKLLFDAGRGSSMRLWQMQVPLGRIDAIFLTHYHSDHTIGLPDLWLTGWIGTPYGRRAPFVDHVLQRVGLDRVPDLSAFHRQQRLHLLPDRVRHHDRVAVEVHAQRGHDLGLGAEADRRAERLAGEHVGAVELAVDHAVEQHFPVGLRLERDVQALVLEVVLLVGDHQWRAVGELDEAELQHSFSG